MKPLTAKEIRNKWIEFFTKKCERKHSHTKSASLVPDNPTLLLNSAGMVPFVPYFIGTQEVPNPPRTITIQKCARVGGKDSDLENIGRTSRHHSFFEMLGNFSFGDYFKAEVIPWAWHFVTEELGLEKEKLTISIFAGDDAYPMDQEAYDLWLKVLKDSGVKDPEKMIVKKGRADNFWGPPGPTGPCGPCSEIHYDRGEAFTDEDERHLEIWNLVFMESDKDDEGKFSPLAKKNIDTGAGLERLAMILQGKENTFETDELFSVLKAVEAEINKHRSTPPGKIQYNSDKALDKIEEENNLYLKIITDHLRCLCFLIADGVRPSNLGRGYVLRMIIRRAARFVYLLTLESTPFLYRVTKSVVKEYADFYPELKENAQIIEDVCKKEEEQFDKTIENGLSILNEVFENTKEELKSKNPRLKEVKDTLVLCGDFAFDIYSTYGFPLELTQEIAEEHGMSIDIETYKKAQEKHSAASNVGAFKVSVLANKAIPEIIKEHGETKFIGYTDLSSKSKVIALLDSEGKKVESLKADASNTLSDETESAIQPFQIILNETPFYAESGGQLGDTGSLSLNDGTKIKITDTKKVEGLFIHAAVFDGTESKDTSEAKISLNEDLQADLDKEKRRLSIAHHSNCHLLQAALKKILGDQVQQAGSQVGPDYTRFDFNFDRGMTKDELKAVENQINEWIKAELPVIAKEMSMDEATRAGALAFFEEKYGDKVRVLFMGNETIKASTELCGGTHVANTKDIELTKVVSEGSVAAGIRRIKLVVSDVAREFIREQEEKEKIEAEKTAAAEKAKAEAKALKKEMAKKALEKVDELIASIEDIGGNKTIIKEVPDLDGDSLKALAEAVKGKAEAKHGSLVLFLATVNNDKPIFIAAVSDDLTKTIKAGDLAKQAAQLCGGGGGGRPNFAQAGGRDASKVTEAIEKVREELKTARV